MKTAAMIVIIVVLLVIASVFFIYLGIYNVSAAEPHTRLMDWVLSTTMDNSVRRHAERIPAPLLTDPAMVSKGFGYYHISCVPCHGAPGVTPSTFARGLNPPPPSLAEAVPDWTPSELYWITKNGIKMSGMPAFSPSYGEDELWALVAFLQRLPAISPQEYKSLVDAAGVGSR